MESLSKNFIWMAAANVVSSLFSVVLFVYLARTLMPDAFGYLSYAFTLIFFVANFIDLGLSTYGMREISKNRPRLSDYVSEIVSFRFIIAGILYVVFVIVAFLWPNAGVLKAVILSSSLMLFVFGFATEWAFQGIEKMHMVFISSTVTSVLQVGLIYILVRGPGDLLKVPVLYFVGALPIIVAFLVLLKFRLKVKVSDLRRMMSYLSSSLVIWLISVFAQVYNGLDIFIVGLFRSIAEVGSFTVARRITGGVVGFMLFLANAVLPRLSHALTKDLCQFRLATQKFLKLAIFLTIFGFLPLILFSKEFISVTFGREYLSANVPLKIMLAGLALVLFNLPYSTGLIACGLEKEVLKQTIGSAAINIVSNFILVPRYGIIGASLSFFLAEAFALAWILWAYKRKMVF